MSKELSPEKILDDYFELIGAEPLEDYQKKFVLDVMQDYATEYAQSILSTKLKEQRQICAEEWKEKGDGRINHDQNIIRNAPEPTL